MMAGPARALSILMSVAKGDPRSLARTRLAPQGVSTDQEHRGIVRQLVADMADNVGAETIQTQRRGSPYWLAGRVLLKIVYLLTCRVLGAASLVFRDDRAKTLSCAPLTLPFPG